MRLRLTLPQLAMLAGLISLSFFFGALILAFGLTIEQQQSWKRFTMPGILWLGMIFLLISSWTLEAARYSLRRALLRIYRGRLAATVVLGALFLAVQAVSAEDLLAQGVAAAANPHGSAFYVFMGIHGAHLLVGMGWLLYLWAAARHLFLAAEQDFRRHRRALGAAAIFWHFMGALWLVLFYFLRRWTT